MGRPKIEADEKKIKEVHRAWRAKEITARKAMELLNMKPNSFYRRVEEYERKPKEVKS